MKKKRTRFNVVGSKTELFELIGGSMFDEDLRHVFLTNGHFSSISFIMLFAEHSHISDLYASTLRIGKKQALILRQLQKRGAIDNINIVVGGLQKRTDKKSSEYNYLDIIEKVANEGKWNIRVLSNHSKIILLETDRGKVVVETSSNLNTNPTIEQFSLEINADLYDYYLSSLFDPSFCDNKYS